MGGVVEAVVNVVTSFIGWLIPTPDIPDFETPEEEKGVLINKQSNNAQIPIVYGRRQVGITRVFLESSGSDNQYLYMAGVVCEGEIEEIEEIYIDDKQVTFDGALTDGTLREVSSSDSNFYKDSSHIQIQAFYGTDNQVASSILTNSTNWTSNHRLRGVCYLAFRFKWNQDIFSSIPQVRVTLKGRKVYDPRTDTTAYTSNSALILLDYLRNTRYGKGLPDSAFESDFASFKTSANECETQITPYTGADQINLFETNAVIDTDQKVIENVKKLLNPMRSLFTYNNGVYKLKIEGTGTAVKTITADHVVGGAKVLGERKNNKYNRVLGTFVNPDKNWQNDTVSFPPADDSIVATEFKHATMLAQDNGTLLEGNFQFPNVTNKFGAEALCEVILRRSRNQLQIQLTLTSEFLELEIGDIVAITYPSGGFNAKPFRVLGLEINEDLTVNVQLFEHQDNFYTFNEKNPIATIADTILPNPFNVQPPASVNLDDDLVEYSDGTVLTRLLITVGASTDQFVEDYEVEVKQTLDKNGNAVTEDYKLVGEGKATNYQVLNVIDEATYSVRVRAINGLGVRSTFTTETRKIIGATETPEDVSDFNISMVGSNQMQLSWTPVADLDIEFYEIRYSTGVSPTEWFDTTNLVQVPRRKSNSVTINAIKPPYHLYIKAVDKLGNESSNPAIISSNVTKLDAFEDISTINEEPTFSGTYTNTFLGADNNNNPAVTLDTISLFDDRAGNFDDADSSGFFFDTGGIANNIQSSGNYIFDNTITLDSIYDATFQVQITMQSDDPYDLFDSGRGATLFDDAKAPFDGNAPTNNSAVLQIGSSTTSLGDVSSFTTVAQQGTFKGRYFKFRSLLNSADNKARPKISGMEIKLVLEKRTETGDDIASGTSTKTITFTNNFYQTPNISVTGQDLETGDFFVVSNKSKTGFDITFKNSSNTIINKTFDYQAIGYGLQS